jgi:hypothetical protein
MLTTVELDHQSGAMTGEVRKIRTDRRSAAELGAINREMGMLPEDTLGVGRSHRICRARGTRASRFRWS